MSQENNKSNKDPVATGGDNADAISNLKSNKQVKGKGASNHNNKNNEKEFENEGKTAYKVSPKIDKPANKAGVNALKARENGIVSAIDHRKFEQIFTVALKDPIYGLNPDQRNYVYECEAVLISLARCNQFDSIVALLIKMELDKLLANIVASQLIEHFKESVQPSMFLSFFF